MDRSVFLQIAALAETDAAVARSAAYVREKIGQFVRRNERVLICFPKKEDACCSILEQAVLGCEAVPIWLGEDRRWVTMLKTAFTSKCNCIIAPPLMMLGLSKVAKHMGTPLFARNVLLSGYPSTDYAARTIVTHLFDYGFSRFEMGYASAIATVLFLVMILCNKAIQSMLRKVGT